MGRVELRPGELRRVTLTADPRLLARFDGEAGQWHIAEGTYRIAVARAADDHVLAGDAGVKEQLFGV